MPQAPSANGCILSCLPCSCNFEFETNTGSTDTLDWEGKVLPGYCLLYKMPTEPVKVAEGTDFPWDFGTFSA
jgi:hypothetical protein